MDIKDIKKQERKRIKSSLRSLSRSAFDTAGQKIANEVDKWLNTRNVQETMHVAYFCALRDEIDTNALDFVLTKYPIKKYLPSFEANKLLDFYELPKDVRLHELTLKNPYEQYKTFLAPNFFDIIFVPGLAFDLFGNRLGRGLGYYDRYLATIDHQKKKPTLIGVALDLQIVDHIPMEDHDIMMDFLCTPTLGLKKLRNE